MISKADKLPLETEPVARDDNTIFTLKPGDQTFVTPYSTDNRSKSFWGLSDGLCFFWQIRIREMWGQSSCENFYKGLTTAFYVQSVPHVSKNVFKKLSNGSSVIWLT